MTASTRSFAALMAALVLVGACGHSASRAETVARETRDNRAVPFVAESPAPATPPEVRLLVTSHRDTYRYTVDWPDLLRSDEQHTPKPAPWPAWDPGIDVIFANASVLVLALGTHIAPDFVTIRAYAKVVADTGRPTGAPIATFECQRFGEPMCAFTQGNAALGIEVPGLDLRLLAGGYISVFASWHVPAASHDRTTSAPEASASWLFRGRAAAPMGASQP